MAPKTKKTNEVEELKQQLKAAAQEALWWQKKHKEDTEAALTNIQGIIPERDRLRTKLTETTDQLKKTTEESLWWQKKHKEDNEALAFQVQRLIPERDKLQTELTTFKAWASNEYNTVLRQSEAQTKELENLRTTYAVLTKRSAELGTETQAKTHEAQTLQLLVEARETELKCVLNDLKLSQELQRNTGIEKQALELLYENSQAALVQKFSPAVTCMEERAAGNGGCGTCAICCKEWRDKYEALEAQVTIADSRMNTLRTTYEELTKVNDSLIEQSSGLEAELKEMRASYEGLAAPDRLELETSLEKIKQLEERVTLADAEVLELRIAYEDLEEVGTKTVEELENNVSILQEENVSLKGQLFRFERERNFDSPIITKVISERKRQYQKWGEQNHPDGTGHPSSVEQANSAKLIYEHHSKIGQLTWMHILAEETLEAFAETDTEKLKTELIQSAAVAVAWCEAIERREKATPI